ncbi:hypothetical protein ACH5RR_016104 [Cinchona calisaya]|uniref:RNase H type-1 domain-containing protein n=1 Tax=Cinchona calisaya TaxID=153742 RepID=A0ABD2ZY45_9GENT
MECKKMYCKDLKRVVDFTNECVTLGPGEHACFSPSKLKKFWRRKQRLMGISSEMRVSLKEENSNQVVMLSCKTNPSAGWKEVVFESDCQELITRINGGLLEDRKIGYISEDIQNLSSYFVWFSFSFVYREGNEAFVYRKRNEVSHRITKFAKSLLNDLEGSLRNLF